MTNRPQSLQLGGLVGGKYRLLKKIGEGGHGRVYRAINTLLGREVAIKVLKPELVGDETAKKRFFREAKTANLVRHSNVVDVLDVGDSDEGPWMVQELLTGEPLSAVLSREGTLTIKHTIELLLPVLSALAVAHARGIAHRDFKPENVFLVRGEEGAITPKILDFGLSKSSIRFGGPRDSDRITGTGVVVGTPAYLAPERVRMESEGDVRGDVWAIGVVLYECTTGFLPFPARTVREMFIQISNGQATPIEDVFPEVDPSFATIVMRCLRKDPQLRYPSAAEIEEDIRRYIDGLSPEVTQRHAAVQLPPDPIATPAEPVAATGVREAAPQLIETSSDPIAAAALAESAESAHVVADDTSSAPRNDAIETDPIAPPRAPKPTPTPSEEEEPSTTSRVLMVVLAIVALAVVLAIWRSSVSSVQTTPATGESTAADAGASGASGNTGVTASEDVVNAPTNVAAPTEQPDAEPATEQDAATAAPTSEQDAAPSASAQPRVVRPTTGGNGTARATRDAAAAATTTGTGIQLRDNR